MEAQEYYPISKRLFNNIPNPEKACSCLLSKNYIER